MTFIIVICKTIILLLGRYISLISTWFFKNVCLLDDISEFQANIEIQVSEIEYRVNDLLGDSSISSQY